MVKFSENDRLYNLLPAIYRTEDAAQGYPLRGLLAIVERNLIALEADVERLYDDIFIETCDQWVIPYIGDLVAVRILHQGTPETFSLRRYVGNTLAYRRRKGTAAILESVSESLTGWPTHVREYFALLSWTQNVNDVRLDKLRTPDIRDIDTLTQLGGPFEDAYRMINVRPNADNRARYNLGNIGIFRWRLQSYPVTGVTARALPAEQDEQQWRFTFDPLGRDGALYNIQETLARLTEQSKEYTVPGPLRRLPLYEEVNVLRLRMPAPPNLANQPLPQGFRPALYPPKPRYFGVAPVFTVAINGTAYTPTSMLIANLSDWPRLGSQYSTYVAVDPELGRIALPQGVGAAQGEVSVGYSYGFSGDVGAGPYNRSAFIARWLQRDDTRPIWRVSVASGPAPPVGAGIVGSLSQALDLWNDYAAAHPDAWGVIAIADSATYVPAAGNSFQVVCPRGSRLAIAAARLPSTAAAAILERAAVPRAAGELVDAEGLRPLLLGSIAIAGKSGPAAAGGALLLDGLLIEGEVTICADDLETVLIAHSTVAPLPARGSGGITASAGTGLDRARLKLVSAICGPIAADHALSEIGIECSIVDGGAGTAVTAPASAVAVTQSTLFGAARVFSLRARDALFTARVHAARQQVGEMSFCYLPEDSHTPRRYCCQPDLALMQSGAATPAQRRAIAQALRPVFSSRLFGEPGYGQLSSVTDAAILTGAGNNAEFGVFSFLLGTQRMQNLAAGLAEYLPLTLAFGAEDPPNRLPPPAQRLAADHIIRKAR